MENDDIHLIKSVYPWDDFAQRITQAANNGKLIVKNKSKAEQMLGTIGIQPSEVSRILNLAKGIIPQNSDSVNPSNEKNKNRLDPKSPSSQVVPATLTDSTISIAQLLDFVNRCFPDILPMDVLKHYGHTSRPDGVLGKGVKHSSKATAKPKDKLPTEAKLPEDPRTLELRGDQRKALANWSRNKVYTYEDAMEIVDGVIKVIGEIAAERDPSGERFRAATVKYERYIREAIGLI